MSEQAWTVGRIVGWAAEYLKRHGASSARLDSQLLLGHVTGLDRVQLYVQFDRPMLPDELEKFRELVRRRVSGEPVAYILGTREFFGHVFVVNRHVLIPRPETEILVDAVIRWARPKPAPKPVEEAEAEARAAAEALAAAVVDGEPRVEPEGAPAAPAVSAEPSEERALRIVDVGVGSGAIAISLAMALPTSTVVGIDISPEALEVAAQNADRLGVRERVKLVRGDGLGPLKNPATVDVVVSNPPYLDAALMATLEKDVRDFEPHGALSGGDDGLSIIRPLIVDAARVLRPGGLLAMEIAGTEQAGAVRDLIAASGAFEGAAILDDYSRRGRVVTAVRLKGP
jgi:release factor glutamine methyltransferase